LPSPIRSKRLNQSNIYGNIFASTTLRKGQENPCYFFYLLSSLAQWPNAYAQALSNESTTDSLYRPRLILDFPLIAYPYQGLAAQMAANHRLGQLAGCNCPRQFGDYINAYGSLSMRQVTAIAKDAHSTGYFISNSL
jgi:hypothetical protein